MRQVNNFRFAAENKETVELAMKLLNACRVKIDFIKEPHSNGLDFDKRREDVKLHTTTYLNKFTKNCTSMPI